MKVRREKSTTTKGHYVTNATLLAEVLRAKALNTVTNELAEMLLLMAQRYSRKSNFIGYSFRDDMISSALVNLCNNALKFNPEKSSNPFAFYTTAIHNSFLQYMADEKKHRNIRDALLVDAGSNPSFNFMEGEKDESQLEQIESDEIIPRIERFSFEDSSTEVNDNKQIDPDTIASSKFRQDRSPGEVVKYSAKDVIIDENGKLIFITPEEKKITRKRVQKTSAVQKVKKPKVSTEPIVKRETKTSLVKTKEAVAKKSTKKSSTVIEKKPTKKISAKSKVKAPKQTESSIKPKVKTQVKTKPEPAIKAAPKKAVKVASTNSTRKSKKDE